MIWCVEDDASIRDIEVYALKSSGFEARGFEDGITALNALKTEIPQLIVLDVMLPGLDGIEFLKTLRFNPKTSEVPVVMSTAKSAEIDKIQGLDLGADYYLTKPFGVMELVSCVKAVLRRANLHSGENLLTLDGLTLDPARHQVTVDGQDVSLTYKEYELLKLFMANPGRAFTREMLFTKVWGEDYVGETRTIDTHILTLRQKLGPYGNIIKTVRNVGYRLEGHAHEQ